MLQRKDIEKFISKNNYDLRILQNGRWIDQKCTPDVISTIADCIIQFVDKKNIYEFCAKDIWDYTKETGIISQIFKKPDTANESSKNEYDKFFSQPLKLFGNSKVLIERKNGNRNIYKINDIDILEYIALSEKNSLYFLTSYIEKVLKDSNIYCYFDTFFKYQNKDKFSNLKENFFKFLTKNTPINGRLECGRIFTKVINPLAYIRNSKGTKKGYLTKDVITYDMLMYNRDNFRDIYTNKPKGMSRKDYENENNIHVNTDYYLYQSEKAKRYLRKYNDTFRNGMSEYLDDININDLAEQIHHIFPYSEFPEIGYYLENLIALTQTQHLQKAHPHNRTREINLQYQRLLLLAKAGMIQDNLLNNKTDKIYEFKKLLIVLSVGLNDENALEIVDMNFNQVINYINYKYDQFI